VKGTLQGSHEHIALSAIHCLLRLGPEHRRGNGPLLRDKIGYRGALALAKDLSAKMAAVTLNPGIVRRRWPGRVPGRLGESGDHVHPAAVGQW